MNQKVNYGVVVSFVLLLIAFFYIGVLAPKDEKALERENREITPMPAFNPKTVFSGNFSKDFENYLADNVGFRAYFMEASSYLSGWKGMQSEKGSIKNVAKDLGTGSTGEQYALWLNNGRIMEVYDANDQTRDAYVQMLNGYAEALPEDVRIISMIAPTQIEFNNTENLSDSQKATIDYVYKNADRRIVTVDAYNALKNHQNEYIFFRTDHHWTQRGAFYAYQAYASKVLDKKTSMKDYTIRSADGFLGTLYDKYNDVQLKKYADTVEWLDFGKNYEIEATAFENGGYVNYKGVIYNVPQSTEMPTYAKLFMCGDHQFAKITTDNKNGKTLLVVKDSYANALLPLLTQDYETVIAIDPRNYTGKVTELVEEYGVNDCLIINYTFTTTFPDIVERMNVIR